MHLAEPILRIEEEKFLSAELLLHLGEFGPQGCPHYETHPGEYFQLLLNLDKLVANPQMYHDDRAKQRKDMRGLKYAYDKNHSVHRSMAPLSPHGHSRFGGFSVGGAEGNVEQANAIIKGMGGKAVATLSKSEWTAKVQDALAAGITLPPLAEMVPGNRVGSLVHEQMGQKALPDGRKALVNFPIFSVSKVDNQHGQPILVTTKGGPTPHNAYNAVEASLTAVLVICHNQKCPPYLHAFGANEADAGDGEVMLADKHSVLKYTGYFRQAMQNHPEAKGEDVVNLYQKDCRKMYGLMAGDPSNPFARRLSAGAALRERSEHLDAGLGKVIADRQAGGAEATKEKPSEKRNASQSPPDKRGPKARGKGGGQRNGGRKKGVCWEFRDTGRCTRPNCPFEHVMKLSSGPPGSGGRNGGPPAPSYSGYAPPAHQGAGPSGYMPYPAGWPPMGPPPRK